MKSPYQQSLGYLASTGTPKGLGVFASREIALGEIVELAPVLHLRGSYSGLPIELQQRVFHWERLAALSGIHALALGYGSVYNHANPANLRYASEQNGEAIRYTAVVDVRKDEELTINYNDAGGEPISTEDNWFAQLGITPHLEGKNDA